MTCSTALFALSGGRHGAVDADMMSVMSLLAPVQLPAYRCRCSRVDLGVRRDSSIWFSNQILDTVNGQTVSESDVPMTQLVQRWYVLRHSHKWVSWFTTPLLSPSTTVRNRMLLLGFRSGRSFLSWWLVGAVCWSLLNRLSVVNRRERLV